MSVRWGTGTDGVSRVSQVCRRSPWSWTPGAAITGIVSEGLFPWSLHKNSAEGAEEPLWVAFCSQPLAFCSQCFTSSKKSANFPWFVQCSMLSVQGASTLHPILETESTCQTQAWPEGQGRAGCKKGPPPGAEEAS